MPIGLFSRSLRPPSPIVPETDHMPAALAHEQVREALQRLGMATVTVIGTAEAKERLRAEEASDREALALAAEVDALAVLIARR